MKLPYNIAELYPFEPKRFKLSNDHSISYLDEGNQETTPTLFLHGNPTWSFFYRKAVLRFRDHSRCIVPDHLGCGLSDKPNSSKFPYRLEDHAENILELVDSLKIEKLILVMHDWGGAIGMSAFSKTPERINRIVLLNTAAFLSQDVPRRILFCRIPIIGEIFVRGLNGFAWPATWMASMKGLNKDVKKGLLFPYQTWRNRIAIWNFVRDIPYEKNHVSRKTLADTGKRLEAFSTTPVMTCWGMKDFCFHQGFLKRWEEIFPKIETHRFNDCGHYILEDDFEGVRSKIEPFLYGS